MYGIIDQVHHNGLENMKMETKKKKVIERNWITARRPETVGKHDGYTPDLSTGFVIYD